MLVRLAIQLSQTYTTLDQKPLLLLIHIQHPTIVVQVHHPRRRARQVAGRMPTAHNY